MQQTLSMHGPVPFPQLPQLSVLPVHGSVVLPQLKPRSAQLDGHDSQW